MWHLTSETDQRVIYVVGLNKEVLIGRNADVDAYSFVIPDDPSISRKHAVLTIKDNELILKDLGSRYGTYKNNDTDKVISNTAVKLIDQDVVIFGKMGSAWKVHVKSLTTCTSTLKGENLDILKECLANLSGVLKSEWDESCNYLTMPAITLTMKVVIALVQGAHIVTVDYWNKCLEAVKSNAPLPEPQKFTPRVVESTLNKENVSFLPIQQRQTLFAGKRFVFFSKRQFEMYKIVIKTASAIPILLSEAKMTKSALCEKDVIVVQYNMNSASQETLAQRNVIQDIVNHLKSKGRRVVTDAEIGLAVLYCSTLKYCNPEFNLPSEIIKQSNHNTKPSNILAQETQDQSQNNCKKENIVIDESLTSANTSAVEASSKRKLQDDEDHKGSSHKKMAFDNISAQYTSNKRKNEESANDNPPKKIAMESESGESEGFNFVNKSVEDNSSNITQATNKKLNLIKPSKRKIDSDDNEDDLFQFVQDENKVPSNSTKSKIFVTDKTNSVSEENCNVKNDKSAKVSNVDLSVLRGSKLDDLMKSNEKILNTVTVNNCNVKKELDEQMSELDLGTTIVTIKQELIVKKEPVQVTEQSGHLKNFKKFKKVWPVKMQVTIIPRSSMIVHKHDDTNNAGNISIN